MRIICSKTYDQMSAKAAGFIAAQIHTKPSSVIGLATGSTPIGIYKKLIKWYEEEWLSFKKCYTVNLDEYCGLSPEHPQSYAYFMHEYLLNHVDILQENAHLPNGLNDDTFGECMAYDSLVETLGGIDLQLLGIGNNGHLGFNEPDDSFHMNTNCVSLTPETIKANSRFFGSEDTVPKKAFTLGIRPIAQAKRILMVVNGLHKADIIYQSLFGPVTPRVPASILQIVPDLVVCGDAEALSVIVRENPEAVEMV